MKHEWRAGFIKGTPDELAEWICACDRCGVDKDDENEHGECVLAICQHCGKCTDDCDCDTKESLGISPL